MITIPMAIDQVHMKCERCTADTRLQRYAVDGYVGHVCASCRHEWDRLLERSGGTVR